VRLVQGIKAKGRPLKTGWYLLRKGNAQLCLPYMSRRLFPVRSDEEHLSAAMQWLCHSQDVCGKRGSMNAYTLRDGWGVPYPETSGYILATFLAYAKYSGDASYIQRATQIGDWEIDIQAPTGGILSSPQVAFTRVFNTGQVILGWCALFELTQDQKYLEAALRAGAYLAGIQEPDGAWEKDTHCGARTYHARVDWALLKLASLSGNQSFTEVALKNLKWVVAQQKENGWFANCGFFDEAPITHVIAYTLRGLLECHLLLGPGSEHSLLPRVIQAANALCPALREQAILGIHGMLPASFDDRWRSADAYSCLTGNAQLACLLFRLAGVTGIDDYRKAAEQAVQAVKQTQNIDTTVAPVRGAIAGSYPIFGQYVANGFPNWAGKFFADALLMKIQYSAQATISA
jgi:hypothetical protein